MARWRFSSPRLGSSSGAAQRAPPASLADRLRGSADLAVAAVLMLLAAFLATLVPLGNLARIVITGLILLTVPGYLLIQAFVVPAKPFASRAVHAALSIGISPAVVGLLAMLTLVMPGGFRPLAIIATVSVGCVIMAAVGYGRRASHPAALTEVSADAEPAPVARAAPAPMGDPST